MIPQLFAVLVLFYLAGPIWVVGYYNNPLLVKLPNGLALGKDNGLFYSWEGIPYAESPSGKLRFEPPKPYVRKWDSIFDATRPYNVCMQYTFWDLEDRVLGVEDCLTVSVYVPKCQRKGLLPVMIFIHGGAFMSLGEGYTPELLMESCRIVYVKFLYRLGPMGFLSTEDEGISGNFGLKDQKLALYWIKKNIANFGGDPSRLMLTGYSAGGASTHMQIMQPGADRLISVAASFSGSALNPWIWPNNSRENAFKLARILNCPKTESSLMIKRCLQQTDAREIVNAVKHFVFDYHPYIVNAPVFGPVVEHANVKNPFINRHPLDIMRYGTFPKIPWLAAFNARDGGYECAEMMEINPKTGNKLIIDCVIRELRMGLVSGLKERNINLELPPEDDDTNFKMCTDVLFANGIVKAMSMMSQNDIPVYGYVYDNPTDNSMEYLQSDRKDYNFGSKHGDDLSLILKVPYDIEDDYREDEKVISKNLAEMLIRYAETGKATYDTCELSDNLKLSSSVVAMTLITKDYCEIIHKRVEELASYQPKVNRIPMYI